MQRKQLVFAVISSALLLQAQASLASGINKSGKDSDWYFATNSSIDFQNSFAVEGSIAPASSYNSADYGFASAIGYMPPVKDGVLKNTRVEAEFSVRSVGSEIGRTKATTSTAAVMMNAIYDIEKKAGFKPYVGFGAGMANISRETENLETSESTTPAYQALAGVSYQSGEYPYTSFNLGYKYFSTIGRSIIKIHPDYDSNSHVVEAAVRVEF